MSMYVTLATLTYDERIPCMLTLAVRTRINKHVYYEDNPGAWLGYVCILCSIGIATLQQQQQSSPSANKHLRRLSATPSTPLLGNNKVVRNINTFMFVEL